METYIKLTPDNMGDVYDISYADGCHPEAFDFDPRIYSLEGLQYVSNLTRLDIQHSSIESIAPLSSLSKLTEVLLPYNLIADVSPLENMTWLKKIHLQSNRIQDISKLGKLTELKSLTLSQNKISNIQSLATLTNLESLDLSVNEITDITPLAGLTKLNGMLWLEKNKITDISPLKDLVLVKDLNLANNDISDISVLKNLTQLKTLRLNGNTKINDIAPLTELIYLNPNSTWLQDTGIEDQKDSLFRIIGVNKLLSYFNANTITLNQKGDVEAARAAYNALSAEEKAYIRVLRLEAAEKNIALLEAGKPVEYYPELDGDVTEKDPMTSMIVTVVDKNNNPVEGLSFGKYEEGDDWVYETKTTDANGQFTYNPQRWDVTYEYFFTLIPEQGYKMVSDNLVFHVGERDGKPYIDALNGHIPFQGQEVKIVVEKENPDPVLPDPIEFADVSDSAWYYNAVQYVAQNGIMTGYSNGKFGPDDKLSRGQFATVIYKMNGQPEVKFYLLFPDVNATDWYRNAVIWSYENGVITGYGNGKFGPDDLITREQMAVMMYRYAQKKGKTMSGEAALDSYRDSQHVSGYAQSAMKWAVGNGIITGIYNGTLLNPQGYASRAECATILQRFVEKYGK